MLYILLSIAALLLVLVFIVQYTKKPTPPDRPLKNTSQRAARSQARPWTPVPNRRHPHHGFKPLPPYIYSGVNRRGAVAWWRRLRRFLTPIRWTKVQP